MLRGTTGVILHFGRVDDAGRAVASLVAGPVGTRSRVVTNDPPEVGPAHAARLANVTPLPDCQIAPAPKDLGFVAGVISGIRPALADPIRVSLAIDAAKGLATQ